MKKLILDHIHIKDPTLISNLKFTTPYFGDHKLVIFTMNAKKLEPITSKRRDWRSYSKETYYLQNKV